ncbi:MAG: UDP-N-acetylmuramate dehydrogenase [Clostridia bacterium]|nr:UDP-N-acetylmuramate dehydrogenase [Clostridia bacterium]
MASSLGCTALENEPMKFHTSFKVGGNARLFIYIKNYECLALILKFIKENGLNFFILGKGTNLLVADSGYDGVVLSLLKSENKLNLIGQDTLSCTAGLPLAKVCVFAMKNNLSGLEFAWGIPGSCGGALYMNAGAYGEDISNIIIEANHIDEKGNIQTLQAKDMELAYRKSYYSDKNFIISSMKFKLSPSSENEVKYKMFENIKKRKSKQPLEFPNAGSIFKRPGGGYYAGALIQDCNLKGFSVGGAMVSPKHAGFIVNTGGATANDVANLIKHIKESVRNNSGIELECEIKTLGDIKI